MHLHCNVLFIIQDGESALLLVADSVRLVRLLLDSGANLDLQNKVPRLNCLILNIRLEIL